MRLAANGQRNRYWRTTITGSNLGRNEAGRERPEERMAEDARHGAGMAAMRLAANGQRN